MKTCVIQSCCEVKMCIPWLPPSSIGLFVLPLQSAWHLVAVSGSSGIPSQSCTWGHQSAVHRDTWSISTTNRDGVLPHISSMCACRTRKHAAISASGRKERKQRTDFLEAMLRTETLRLKELLAQTRKSVMASMQIIPPPPQHLVYGEWQESIPHQHHPSNSKKNS